MGSSDEDVLRDGDALGKAARYERAAEFLEVFTRALTSEVPFDWSGDHYAVRDAWSGLRPHQRPHPPISLGGSSPPGIALAARFADVYGIAPYPLERTAAAVAEVRAAAAEHGREIRVWRHARFLLADSDVAARAAAERIATTLAAHGHGDDHHLASSFVGSPATAARAGARLPSRRRRRAAARHPRRDPRRARPPRRADRSPARGLIGAARRRLRRSAARGRRRRCGRR